MKDYTYFEEQEKKKARAYKYITAKEFEVLRKYALELGVAITQDNNLEVE